MTSIIDLAADIAQAYRAKPWPLSKPRVVQFPVNDICNAGCQMCHIWKNKLDTQISVEDLSRALRDQLYSEVRSVGINGGEPTLRKDLPQLVDMLFRRLPRLKTINLITNALVANKVIASIEAVGGVIAKHRGIFDVMISLDGVGDLHDLVRGRKGNFRNAERVLAHVKSSALVSSHQLACTVVKDNVYGLHDLLDYAVSQQTHIKYRLAIPHKRLYTDNVHAPFALSHEEKYHLCLFLENLIRHYEPSAAQRYFYRSLVDQLMKNQPRKAGCNWQHRGVTISARGELLYCAVESDVLGKIVDADNHRMYLDNAPSLQRILDDKCDHCHHDYGGIPAGGEFVKQCAMEAAARLGFPWRKLVMGETLQPVGKALRLGKMYRRQIAYGLVNPDPRPAPYLEPAARPYRVMMCGWYGTETLGDKAILGGVVRTIRQSLGNVELCLVSLDEYVSRFTRRQMPELAELRIVSVDAAARQIPEIDLLVFAGGPLMAVNAVLDILHLFKLAASHKVPSVLAGCGIGPLGGSPHKQIIARILKLSTIRMYRDRESLSVAAGLGVDVGNDIVSEDPAHSWLRHARPQRDARPGKVLLLALRDWPHRQYGKVSNANAGRIKHRYEQEILNTLGILSTVIPDLTIIPFAMCTNHHGGDDRWYYRRLLNDNPGPAAAIAASLDRDYLTREVSPQAACAVFAGADAVMAMRFHGVVFALETGTPVVALDYTLGQGKISALATRRRLPCVPLGEISIDALLGHIRPMLEGRSHHPGTSPDGDFAADFTRAMQTLTRR